MNALDPNGRPSSLRLDEDGNLKIAGTFAAEAPVGGATEAKQDAQIALMPTPVDSLGAALPADFEYLAETYGYTSGKLTTIVKTKGANTWTQTLTYTGDDLTGVSRWVKA